MEISSVFPAKKGIILGTSTRQDGPMKKAGKVQKEVLAHVVSTYTQGKPLLLKRQLHTAIVADVDKDEAYSTIADGLITSRKDIFLGVTTADCLPVLFYDAQKNIIGAAHAGYKGLLAGILSAMMSALTKKGSNKKTLHVFIGPAIGICCYTVPSDRVVAFSQQVPALDITSQKNGSTHLDLKEVAKKVLILQGIEQENIFISHLCTSCNSTKYYSYRKTTDKENLETFVSYIGIV